MTKSLNIFFRKSSISKLTICLIIPHISFSLPPFFLEPIPSSISFSIQFALQSNQMTEPQGSANQKYQPANALQITNEQFQGDSPQTATTFTQKARLQVFRLIRYIRTARRTTLIGLAIALILLIGLGYSFIPRNFNGTIEVQQYYFQVFCPINDQIAQRNFQEFIDKLHLTDTSKAQLKKLKQFVEGDRDNNIDKYIVWVKAERSNDTDYTQLYYCGYTRQWNSTDCSKPKPICSIPGPLFYVHKNQVIDVAWVYNIDEGLAKELQFVQYDGFDYCYNQTKNGDEPEHCKIDVKSAGKSQCTYLDPTELNSTITEKMTVSYKHMPIGAHIHGLQVRPTFDGNPLSSISMDGRFGVGFQSMGNQEYYSLFNNYTPTSFIITPDEENYIKINRYDNAQAPGNLWYHDHSMHATFANVAMGLAGGYIIHDKEIDSKLSKGQNQIIIIIAAGFPTNQSDFHDAHMKYNPSTAQFNSTSPPVFSRNQTYRIRVLNGEFDAIFTNMRFVAGCQKTIDGINFSNCSYVLNLSVIGADSTLFDKPINNVTSFTLASAQRIQFLLVINGSGINELPEHIKQVYLVSDGDRTDVVNTYIRRMFSITDSVRNTMNPAIPKSIGVPFYNLSQISSLPCTPQQLSQPSTSTNCIAARRMRPLLRDKNFNFFINGHYKFSESGASENPTIGTTQDWYFINTMLGIAIPHPMHIHLISFQVLQRGSLKVAAIVPIQKGVVNCTFYEIDYYTNAGYRFKQPSNYSDNCRQLRKDFDVSTDQNSKLLKNYFPENKPNNGFTNLYGFEVEEKLAQGQKGYVGLNCKESNTYKYVCDDNLYVPTWYKHWKEVVTIYPAEYIRVRVRWASADYDETVQPYPFFRIPEDQLIEFPGYVYHCHFLQHEDNELMRPIMMQPSPLMNRTIENPDLRRCMNGKPEGWASRAECINKIVGCL